jgi:hypothetical protein
MNNEILTKQQDTIMPSVRTNSETSMGTPFRFQLLHGALVEIFKEFRFLLRFDAAIRFSKCPFS